LFSIFSRNIARYSHRVFAANLTAPLFPFRITSPEGFDRMTTAELISFVGYARGSASEVKSMILVVTSRPTLRPTSALLREIEQLARSCIRQLSAWTTQIEKGAVQGKRHLTGPQQSQRKVAVASRALRRQFLLSLTPLHPLYDTPEARIARGEPSE
jgi:hypothetical protein